jgi:hypothetical protein
VLSNAPAEAHLRLRFAALRPQLLPAGMARDMFELILLSRGTCQPDCWSRRHDDGIRDSGCCSCWQRGTSDGSHRRAFYWVQTAAARRTHKQVEDALTVVSLAVSAAPLRWFALAVGCGTARLCAGRWPGHTVGARTGSTGRKRSAMALARSPCRGCSSKAPRTSATRRSRRGGVLPAAARDEYQTAVQLMCDEAPLTNGGASTGWRRRELAWHHVRVPSAAQHADTQEDTT